MQDNTLAAFQATLRTTFVTSERPCPPAQNLAIAVTALKSRTLPSWIAPQRRWRDEVAADTCQHAENFEAIAGPELYAVASSNTRIPETLIVIVL